jgi:endogenous inhibitor of DNA gyrase (YacG/DUF329 family)
MPTNTPTKTQCPICRKPTDPEFRPFCSRGCRDRDLVNWLDEGYKMPVPQDEEGAGEPDQV